MIVTEVAEPCAVTTGLYGINNFGSETEGYVYHFNPESSAVTVVAGLTIQHQILLAMTVCFISWSNLIKAAKRQKSIA